MKTIQVIPNPYCALDADGVPQGVVGLPGARMAWIGAALDPVASTKSGKSRFYYPSGNAKKGEKSIGGMRVVTLAVADTNVRAAIANAVLDGSLIVASKDDAAKLGLVKDYLDPEKALAREKERALAAFRNARLDEKAELGAIPHEPTKDDAEEAPAPAPAATSPAGRRVTANVNLQSNQEG